MLSKFLIIIVLAIGQSVYASNKNSLLAIAPDSVNTSIPPSANERVMTYINPILAGDHPDPTLLKVGDDFYMCGSSFHFAPNLPILHSKDLLHWETISRVVPTGWNLMKSDAPGGGIWQGAITYFYGAYRIYFANSSSGGQYFAEAKTPQGPWSEAVKVAGTAETGFTGYDNSVFVDDDGTPYLLIKGGQMANRIQQINAEGNLTGKLINMDWVNANKRYSWAEGPVMCKRNGWYYYFVAGDVTGGQYVLRSKELSADSTKWEKLGKVVTFSEGQAKPFPGPNHISAPFQLANGTWWCMAQSYEKTNDNDWSGQGRQELLCRIDWDVNGKPNIHLDANLPALRPDLPLDGLSWKLPRSDEFDSTGLKLQWHFINKQSAQRYSLKDKPGWLTIQPEGKERCHVLQKEGGHYYTLVTKVNNSPTTSDQEGGLYVTNGNDSVNIRLYSGYREGKRKIIFRMGSLTFETAYTGTEDVWLKMDRQEHEFRAYCSNNGVEWVQVGQAINSKALDKVQPNYNSWVGNSIGLYASGNKATFDFFVYKDGYSTLPLAGYNNYFGIRKSEIAGTKGVSNLTDKGGWLMLGGVDIGRGNIAPKKVEITASSSATGKLEIWIDDLGNKGRKIAVISLASIKGTQTWQKVTSAISNVSGQHDLYVKIDAGANACFLKSIRFLP